jgi:hypothetical protein
VVLYEIYREDGGNGMNFVHMMHTQTDTNNANKTCTLLQTTGGRDERNIVKDILYHFSVDASG